MADACYSTIRLERRGAVARLTLDRPARRNALTHAMMVEIGQALSEVRDDESCRIVVLRGAGGNFSAGGDLDAMDDMPPLPAEGTDDPLIPAYRQLGDALLALNNLPQATIAIVEGAAVGGGFGMACCVDVPILHTSAKFGVPEAKVGFIPSQIIPFLVRRLGEGAVRELVVTGRVIDAEEARRLGIGGLLCRSETEIEATLDALLEDIFRMEPQALATGKRLVLSCATEDDRAVLDDAAESLVGLLRRPQARAGIAAFKAKRAPPWARRDDA
jgi:isohexenylglutaconyl-CoA hydratase